MTQFDRDIDRHQTASGETFPENIRIGVTPRMLPDGPLKQDIVLNSARLTTWGFLKADIVNGRRPQAVASSTPQPMDLSAHGNVESYCPILLRSGSWIVKCENRVLPDNLVVQGYRVSNFHRDVWTDIRKVERYSRAYWLLWLRISSSNYRAIQWYVCKMYIISFSFHGILKSLDPLL